MEILATKIRKNKKKRILIFVQNLSQNNPTSYIIKALALRVNSLAM